MRPRKQNLESEAPRYVSTSGFVKQEPLREILTPSCWSVAVAGGGERHTMKREVAMKSCSFEKLSWGVS